MMRLISRFRTGLGLGLRILSTTKNTYVTNINNPICVNCVHFFIHSDRLDNTVFPIYLRTNDSDSFDNSLGKCSKFGKKDLVTGDITYEWAAVCRTLDRKCGESGKYFYSKHYNDV